MYVSRNTYLRMQCWKALQNTRYWYLSCENGNDCLAHLFWNAWPDTLPSTCCLSFQRHRHAAYTMFQPLNFEWERRNIILYICANLSAITACDRSDRSPVSISSSVSNSVNIARPRCRTWRCRPKHMELECSLSWEKGCRLDCLLWGNYFVSIINGYSCLIVVYKLDWPWASVSVATLANLMDPVSRDGSRDTDSNSVNLRGGLNFAQPTIHAWNQFKAC